MPKKKKDWFKLKRYPHIGLPLKTTDRQKWIEPYVTSVEKVAKHRFLPFIHRTSRVKKFRKEYCAKDGTLCVKTRKKSKIHRVPDEKVRELFYASHLDSLIFNYYSKILSKEYDDLIKSIEYNLNEVVCAYRSVPIEPDNDKSKNKCNINFADDVFNYIREFSHNTFYVIAFDISSFFDNLDHKILREMWCKIMNTDKLSPDHFNVYKNITRFSHIDIVDIFNVFQDRIFIQKRGKDGTLGEKNRKYIDKIKFMRNNDAIAFCTKKEFLKAKHKLLQPSKTKTIGNQVVPRTFGIPQGSPISSTLANIYLLHFDKIINDFITKHGGLYRRYSDDMIVVCPQKIKTEICELVYESIQKYKLEIQEKKTQIFRFKRIKDKLKCGQEFKNGINWNKNLTYLGFEFDGEYTYLKSGSVSRYYRNMKRHVKKAVRYSKYKNTKNSGVIFRSRIYKKYSYKGAKRIRKYIWSENENKFIHQNQYNWGNFLTYTKKAAVVMNKNKINSQTSNHWKKLNELLPPNKN